MKILFDEKIYKGKWLEMNQAFFHDENGKEHCWEYVNRVKNGGAVGIIAKLVPSEKIILVRQFRIPVNKYVIEFPAGLIDENETFVEAALRELKEETGFTGKILEVTPRFYSSPGMTSESIALVKMEIEENSPENQNVTPSFDETENIETILVDIKKLKNFCIEAEANGDLIDAKLGSIAFFS